MSDFRSSYRWKQERKSFLKRCRPICHICLDGIDMRLSGNHPLGPTVDHVVAVIDGGSIWDWSNWAPAHRSCNERKEADTRQQIRQEARRAAERAARAARVRPSRNW